VVHATKEEEEAAVHFYTPNFTPIGAQIPVGSQKCKFYEISVYESPAGAFPLRDLFNEIFRICGQKVKVRLEQKN